MTTVTLDYHLGENIQAPNLLMYFFMKLSDSGALPDQVV